MSSAIAEPSAITRNENDCIHKERIIKLCYELVKFRNFLDNIDSQSSYTLLRYIEEWLEKIKPLQQNSDKISSLIELFINVEKTYNSIIKSSPDARNIHWNNLYGAIGVHYDILHRLITNLNSKMDNFYSLY